MKNVTYNVMDTQETVKQLYAKLQQEQESMKNNPSYTSPNPYETVVNSTIERMKFLLKVVPTLQHVKSPSVESINPYTQESDRVLVRRSSTEVIVQQKLIHNIKVTQAVNPLSKSTSIIPVTSTAVSKVGKTDCDKGDSQAFNRRVDELRTWLQSYYGWKNCQDDQSSSSKDNLPPLQAIVSFTQIPNISVKELEGLIRVHMARAQTRVQGLLSLNQVLAMCSFGLVRHQMLGSISRPLVGGTHFMDAITSCGYKLALDVDQAFSYLFQELVKTFSSPQNDPTSRMLGLGICRMSFLDSNVNLLQNTRVFQILCDIVSETDQDVPKQKKTPVSTIKEEDLTPEELSAKQEEEERREREKIEREEAKRKRITLKNTAWTAFKLLTTQVSNWKVPIEGSQKSVVYQLQTQVFDLMCAYLQRISQSLKRPNIQTEIQDIIGSNTSSNQCYQLLFLLYNLGSGPLRLKALSAHENVSSLLSILGSNTSPQSQRLVLRLLRRILPLQNSESAESVVNLLLDEIGTWLFCGKYSEFTTKTQNTESSDKPRLLEGNPDSESDVDEKPPPPQVAVYLHLWSVEEKQFIDACTTTIGADFFLDPKNPTATPESRTSAILQEVTSNGSSLIKTGSSEQCTRLGTALGLLGGSVSIIEVTPEQKESKKDSNRHNSRIGLYFGLMAMLLQC
jgi:hypothetical protein